LQTKKFGILLIFSVLPFVGLSFLPTAFAGDPNGECPYGINSDTGFCWCTPLNGITGTTIINGICDDRPLMQVGGEFIPIDTTAVLLAGVETNALSILSAFVVIGAIAFGVLVISVKRKRN